MYKTPVLLIDEVRCETRLIFLSPNSERNYTVLLRHHCRFIEINIDQVALMNVVLVTHEDVQTVHTNDYECYDFAVTHKLRNDLLEHTIYKRPLGRSHSSRGDPSRLKRSSLI
jgi:hypothetical protein